MPEQPPTRSQRRQPRLRLSLRASWFSCSCSVVGWAGTPIASEFSARLWPRSSERAAPLPTTGSGATANSDILRTKGRPRVPKWLADRVGIDYIANVILVDLEPYGNNAIKADDATLAQVAPSAI